MQRKINNREFYKWIISLILPMAGQNLINVGVTSADVVMTGLVSPEALSAVSLASQVQFILTIFYFGLSSGAMVLMSQYWGKRDYKAIKDILTIAIRFSFIFGTIFAIIVFIMPQQIMKIFTDESLVIKQGADYLRIVGVSYILSSFSITYLNTIRSIERVLVAAITYTISFLVNVVANSILIFGLFGIEPMGASGAAVGTVIARSVEVIIVIWYSKYKLKDIKLKLKDFIKINKALLRDFVKYSAMVVANELVWGIGVSMISVIIGHMGVDVIGANSVAQVIKQLAMVVTFGIAAASAIVIGKSIGKEKYDLVWIYAKKMIKISLISGIIGSVFMLVVSPFIIDAFTITQRSKEYLYSMLLILSYTNIEQSFNSTLIVGIFRGGGDTKFGLIVDAFSLWMFALPIGAICAFILKIEVPYVYMILLSDEIIKIPFVFKRFISKKWIKNITREMHNFD